MRLTILDDPFGLLVGEFGRLPAPEPKEVMVVLLEKVQIGIIVEDLRRILAFRQSVAVVLEVMPLVTPGQVDGLARAVREIARVRFQDAKRAAGLHGIWFRIYFTTASFTRFIDRSD